MQRGHVLMAALALVDFAVCLKPQRIHLVVNPFGGGGAGLQALHEVLPIFEKAEIEVQTLKTEYAGHARYYASSIELDPQTDAFVGIGGDGTAHEIANGMLQRAPEDRVPIGIIPAGSGNTWAFDLGLDEAVEAAHVIASGATTAVDVLAVSAHDDAAANSDPSSSPVNEYAINICGFGLPAAVLQQANALRWLGSAQYELAGLLLILSNKARFGATLEVEAADGTVSTHQLNDCSFVQAQLNMHMGKRVPFAPSAVMNDGLIDLVLVKSGNGLDILHANALARGAAHEALPFVDVIRCKRYTLTPHRRSAGINLDGELAGGRLDGSGAFTATCVPQALEVFASSLNATPRLSSGDVEPKLILSLMDALGRSVKQ